MRRPPAVTRARSALTCTLLVLPLAACGASADALEEKTGEVAAVTDVTVAPMDEAKDSPVPAVDGAQQVAVTVAADVEVDQVLEVFDVLADEIEDEEVGSVVVTVDSPGRPRLVTGVGAVPGRDAVTTLLAARDDRDTQEFTLIVLDDEMQVRAELAQTPYRTVVDRAEAYAKIKGVKRTEVASTGRSLTLDTDENLALARARAELVREVDDDFELRAAPVTGSGNLELVVAPGGLQAAKVMLDQELDSRHGPVTVTSS